MQKSGFARRVRTACHPFSHHRDAGGQLVLIRDGDGEPVSVRDIWPCFSVDSPAADLQDMLCDGLVEVIISCQPSGRSDPRLKYLRLFKEELCVILPPSHPLAAQSQIGLLDLKDEKFVQRTQCEHDCSIDGFFDELGADFQTVYRSDRDDWILAMVSGGLGFGLLGRNSIGAALVAARPLASPSLFRIVNLVTVRGRPHSAAVGALLHEAMRTPWSGEAALSVQTLAQADPPFSDGAAWLGRTVTRAMIRGRSMLRSVPPGIDSDTG